MRQEEKGRPAFALSRGALLAFRTIEGGASGLHEPRHGAGAGGRHAGLAFSVVDPEGMLEIAEGPVDLRMVAQGGAAGFHRLREHIPDDLGELVRLVRRLAFLRHEGTGGRLRVEAGTEQGLAYI